MSATAWEQLRQRVRARTRLRHWWRRLDPRRAALPRAFLNGFPKGGTHLLRRCVTLLPGMAPEEMWVGLRLARRLAQVNLEGEAPVAEPPAAALEELGRLFTSLGGGEFLMGHMRYHPAIPELLEARSVRALLILRDPRDIVVSLSFHIVARTDHRQHEHFTRRLKSDAERLLACIAGVEAAGRPAGEGLLDIGTRLRLFAPWRQARVNYTARFERLVGPQGGGTAEAQRAEVQSIARHLGLAPTREQVESIAARLFGQASLTFRRGQIGAWREHFREEHKAAFKRVAGQQLIELGYERDLDW